MIAQATFTLTNGVQIPRLGCGTWQVPAREAASLVSSAIELGYRLIDTAQAYGNEAQVGKGVRSSGIERDKLFVVSKIHPDIRTYDEAAAAVEASIETLDIGPIDLMMVHAPRPFAEMDKKDAPRYGEENREVWRALEDALEQGKVRSIGVSNFEQEDVDSLLQTCRVAPMVNEIRCHIAKTPEDLITYCKSKGIQMLAYSPMGEGRLLKDNEIKAIATRYGVTTGQVCLRYDIQLGTIPVPKTLKEKYLRENLDVNFDLTEEEMDMLRAMHEK